MSMRGALDGMQELMDAVPAPPAEARRHRTAQDVADRLGVSRSTVSRAFTPGGSVSPDTRRRVLAAAKELGYSYIVITDHSQVLTVAHGMTPGRFEAHIEAIREVSQELEGFDVLAGIEVDILKDGSLDMDHGLLEACDWVVGSVHVSQQMEPEAMTSRLLAAIDTGLVDALGHPTGRILGGRDGYSYDMDKVLVACRDRGVAVEINGSGGRLDFNARHARLAHQMGVKIVLGSDAHSTRGLGAMRAAVGQARRAGLRAEDVLNCQGAGQMFGGR